MMSALSMHAPHSLQSQLIIRLFADLKDARVEHAVMRNHEQLPFQLGARDLDIVVAPEHLDLAISVVIRLARDFDLLLANAYADERITQMALVRRQSEGLVDLKIDFFTSSQVYGVETMSAREMLRDLRWHNGIPVVSEVVMLLDKWLFHLAVGRRLHRKYDVLFGRIVAEHLQELLRRLSPLLGADDARRQLRDMASGRASAIPTLSVLERTRLLLRLWKKQAALRPSLRAPLLLRFFVNRIRDRLRPHGLLISVSGPDGSGKTTVIDLVLAELRQCYGPDSIDYHHFRPGILPRIAEVAQAAGARSTVDKDYARPHRGQASGTVFSLVRLGYYALDYVLGYLAIVRPALTDRKILLFDRYYDDMICDPRRSRIKLPDWCLRAVGRLVPRPRFAFFIKVKAELVYARKQELTYEQIKTLNARYGDLVRRGWMIEIGNEETPDRAAAAIVDHILVERDRAARKALRMVAR